MNEYITIDNYAKFYYKDRQKTILHREDGPAIEWLDGDRVWYLNGVCHRMGGPAVEWRGGGKAWYINDVLIFTINNDGTVIAKMK